MRSPAFWNNPPERPGFTARLLAPLGWAYAAATARRLRGVGQRARVPVICIGNLNAGGTGKTPAAMALIERLQARGCVVHVLSRGYGGSLAGPLRVSLADHSAAQVGDEPLLLAAFAPVWVARDRGLGLLAAQMAAPDVILLDDGFQNPSVVKDLSIVVVDAEVGFGNGRCLPAGPLREPVGVGLARAGMVLAIGPGPARAAFRARWGDVLRLPVIVGTLAPVAMGIDWRTERVLAFAGIGRPEKFFATLRAEGATLVRTVALEDHQPLSNALMLRLQAEAVLKGAQLVTTEKDAARLPAVFRADVLTLPVRLQIEDWTALDAAFVRLGL